MSADNSGPAFPANRDMRHNPDWDHEPGMTLRDYFAAKAMQALPMQYAANGLSWLPATLAGEAYVIADAMLKARQA